MRFGRRAWLSLIFGALSSLTWFSHSTELISVEEFEGQLVGVHEKDCVRNWKPFHKVAKEHVNFSAAIEELSKANKFLGIVLSKRANALVCFTKKPLYNPDPSYEFLQSFQVKGEIFALRHENRGFSELIYVNGPAFNKNPDVQVETLMWAALLSTTNLGKREKLTDLFWVTTQLSNPTNWDRERIKQIWNESSVALAMAEAISRYHFDDAFRDEDTQLMLGLIDLGFDYRIKSPFGNYLMKAAAKGSISLVEFFIDAGVDVNEISYNQTALKFASDQCQKEVVIKLIDAGARTDGAFNPIFSAIGCPSLIEYLLGIGVDKNSMDATGRTLLEVAFDKSELETFELLLKIGANPNTLTSLGETILNMAISGNANAIVKILLKYGASPNALNAFRVPPVIVAVDSRNIEALQLLVRHPDINIDARNPISGYSGLMLAGQYGYTDAAKILLQNGASAEIKDEMGRNVVDIAKRYDRLETAALITKSKEKRRVAIKEQ